MLYTTCSTCTCYSLTWLIPGMHATYTIEPPKKAFWLLLFHNIFTSFWIFRIINKKWVKTRKSSLFIINTMNTMHTIPWHKLDQLFRSITAIPCKFSVHALSVAKLSLERMQLFLVFCTIKFLGYAFWINEFFEIVVRLYYILHL